MELCDNTDLLSVYNNVYLVCGSKTICGKKWTPREAFIYLHPPPCFSLVPSVAFRLSLWWLRRGGGGGGYCCGESTSLTPLGRKQIFLTSMGRWEGVWRWCCGTRGGSQTAADVSSEWLQSALRRCSSRSYVRVHLQLQQAGLPHLLSLGRLYMFSHILTVSTSASHFVGKVKLCGNCW